MLARIELTYNARDAMKAWPESQYECFRTKLKQFKLPEKQEDLTSWYERDGFADDHEMLFITASGLTFEVSKIAGVRNLDAPDAIHNVVYQISVANIGLMQITAVEVHDDMCTDMLQEALDDGWRILAVCPPNDARRPAYVLGHTDRSKK